MPGSRSQAGTAQLPGASELGFARVYGEFERSLLFAIHVKQLRCTNHTYPACSTGEIKNKCWVRFAAT